MLTRKQRAFVEHYLACGMNATRAAVAAGYSPKTARSMASRLLTNVNVAEAIHERLAELAITADEVLARLSAQARAEYAAYIGADGAIDLAGMVGDGKAHLIKAVRQGAYGLCVEFHDAQHALELLGKVHKLFTDRIEHTGAGVAKPELIYTLEDLAEARRRALELEERLLGGENGNGVA